ncbi:SusC/RagA family TonB-linked outer membrane protein [Segetibacter sp. 3557_3]|uniref:SusC/RagA family TonB-linked outer membrane protein n=1 Tax=Segetibacter sp. 3557_3 TaxID=2547429 RepID=UPI001404729F|nr:SusC/RagA family TonB-linked outer membrane protein [Segetibacter sp. 3557_3]
MKTVTGAVTSHTDQSPLPNVSVKLQGSNSGTQTDERGNFTIAAPANGTLIFSHLGYQQTAVKVGANERLSVVMTEENKSLAEVVVTSFGIKKDRKTLGYGVSQVTAEEVRRAPTPDITNALTGKIAGVQVSGTGGGFSSSNIIIRGFSTFTGSNQPLMVVDGVPIDNSGGNNSVNSGVANSNRASDINPEDIETINVLKGAAATVLYGSRAASGAILITTKRGKNGTKNQVTFSSNYGVGTMNLFPELQNEYAQGDRGVYRNNVAGSWGPRIQGQTVNNWFGQQEALAAYPNNVKDILQQAISNQNDISFSGATDKYNYRMSYGNAYETGLVPGNVLRKNNLTLNAGTAITPKLRVNTFLSFVSNISDRTQAGNQGSNPIWRGIYTPRSYDLTNLPFEDPNGGQLWFTAEDHPYWAINHVKYHQEVNRFFGNVNLNYAFAPWLQADLKIGGDIISANAQGFDDKNIRGNGNTNSAGKGGLSDNQDLTRNINSYFTLTANKRFSSDWYFSATVGNEVISNFARSLNATGLEIVVPGFDNLKNFVTYTNSDSYTKYRTVGVFGDFVAEFRNYLTLNLKARNDFPSTLMEGRRSIFYPALAISYLPTEMFPALKGNFLTSAKIRANVGEVGKGAQPYRTDTYYGRASAGDGFGSTGVSFPFNGLAAYTYNNSAGNPLLTPEFTREIELGTELALFNNRLRIDGSVYQRITRSLIFNVPVPASSGFTSVNTNAGKLSTKGLELLITGTPIQNQNFSWESAITFTTFKSMVKELAPGVQAISLGGFTSPNVQLMPNEEYGQIYSTFYRRDENGSMIIGTNGLPLVAGGVKKIGNPNPRFTMGFTNTFTYKSFSLSFLLDGRYKGDLLSRTVGDLRINGVAKETAEYPRYNADGSENKPYLFDGVLENKTPNNVYVSAQDYWSTRGKYVAWEGYVLDASFIKLREATITYNVPKALLARTKFISGLQLSVYGRNLLTYAPNFPHLDPEQNLLGVSNSRGIEFGIQPVSRIIGGSLRINF